MRTLWHAWTASVVLLVAVAGCAGDSAEPPPGGGATNAPTLDAPGDTLTVDEAVSSDRQGRVTITGFVIDVDGEVRMCAVVLESFPPQCGEPSLAVEGVDVAAIDGAQTSRGVTWVDQVTLTGELVDGMLRTSAPAQAS